MKTTGGLTASYTAHNVARWGGAGNRNQKVFAAVNYVTKSDCGEALHPNVFVAAPF